MPNVLIVDDHLAFAEGLAVALRARKGVTIADVATTGQQALEIATDTPIDVVTLDLELPDIHGLEVARLLQQVSRPPAVILVSAYANPNFVLEAHTLELHGYILKEDGVGAIVEAIRRSSEGRQTFSAGIKGISKALGFTPGCVANVRSGGPGLTGRQRSVLRLVAEGRSIGDTARELGIRERTARLHWYGALDRLGLRTLGPTQVKR